VRFAADGAVDADFPVDAPAYRRDVFPLAWTLAPTGAYACLDGDAVVVSTSGPLGAALIAVALPRP
jgi:hypothetical protein